MPIFWQPHEPKYLTGSYLLEQIDERNVAIEEDYLAICNIAPEFRSICNLQEFKWSRMCVCSRNFGLVINGIQTAAMVPYADMLNHYRPRETKWQFTVVSLQPIAATAELRLLCGACQKLYLNNLRDTRPCITKHVNYNK
jgi:histone-lysine N-methyltransferase SETD3